MIGRGYVMNNDAAVRSYGIQYFQQLIDKAKVIFDNQNKKLGSSNEYTTDRNPDGLLNGGITAQDIAFMRYTAEDQFVWFMDTLVLPHKIWAYLLRQKWETTAFGDILFGNLVVMPTDLILINPINRTSTVLLLNSRDLDQVVAAKHVKVLQ
jgi:hypothetical protein